MSKSDEFRHYAEEAMRWAHYSKNEKKKAILVDLAQTWVRAATYQECYGKGPHSQFAASQTPIASPYP